MAARSFMGAGDVYIDRIVDGVSQGLVGPIYANKLALQPNVDTQQSTSKGRYDYGQVLETVNLQQPADFSMELKEATSDVLSMAFLGTTATLVAASGAMVDQAASAVKGKWIELGHLNLAALTTVETQASRAGVYALDGDATGDPTAGTITVADNTAIGVYTATFTAATTFGMVNPSGTSIGTGTLGSAFSGGGIGVTITAGTTPAVAGDKFTITVSGTGTDSTLVEGTDYKLNRPMGLLMVLPGSTLLDGAPLKVTGAYAGATGTRISGAVRAEVRCRILFDGINQADGSECTVTVHEAVLSADSEFDFLADSFGNVSLSGTLKTPVGKNEPFTVDLKTTV